ncbi:hypothetical protein Tco_1212774 [Tanacetum coccineum]
MWDSPAYKTYLAFATGAASPKKAKNFKKPASLSRKRTLVTGEEEEPEPAKKVVPSNKYSRKQSIGVQILDTPIVSVSKKKAPTTTERSKGIDLLFEAALLEEAKVKKVLKKSRRETTIHQAGGSSDGTGSKPGVPDEPKGKSVDTNEGTGLKLGVLDVSKADSFKSEYESWDDSSDEAMYRKTTKEDEESDDAFVHTLEDYVPTNDETNDESNNVDEEEYERINEELYGDVNVRLTYAKPINEEKGNKDMTNPETVNAEHKEGSQEVTSDQVKDDAQETVTASLDA